MPTVVGLGTTFNLPNYVGELFNVTPSDTPFLSMAGNLSGGDMVHSTQFEWQGEDLRPTDQRVRLEGADAPPFEERARFNYTNVVQIVQEAYAVSYTKQAAWGQYDGVNIDGSNPVTDEFGHQGELMLKQIKRDLEYAFINGQRNVPTDNTTARSTEGIISATETNVSRSSQVAPTNGGRFTVTVASPGVFTTTGGVHGLVAGDQVQFTEGTGVLPTVTLNNGVTRKVSEGENYFIKTTPLTTTFTITDSAGGAALAVTNAGTDNATRTVGETSALTEDTVLDLLQEVYDNGGIMEDETRTLMTNSGLKRALTNTFITAKGYQEESRTVGGVHVQTLETDFGRLNVVLNRHMPKGVLQVVSMEEITPVFLMIPGKGFLFSEMLAKTGAQIKAQVYGEVGLKWGNERKHGKVEYLAS